MGIPFLIFLAARTLESRGHGEAQLSQPLRGLFALAESYPDLESSAGFQSRQASFDEIGESIQSVSRYFNHVVRDLNTVVRDLNTVIQIFPSNLVAGLFRFRPHAYFELDGPDERQVPTVSARS
jgi:LemA protein